MLWPAALICSVIANAHRNKDERPEPFTAADFMPGAEVKTREQELREWADAVERGETFEADPEELEEFKRQMQSSFKNIAPAQSLQ